MKRIFVAVLILIFIGAAIWVTITRPLGDQKVDYAPALKTCSVAGQVHYCIYEAAGGATDTVIYHFHGRNLDENSWNDDTYYTAMIQKYWQLQKIKPPRVVSVSFGPVWLLAKKGITSKSGKLESLMETLVAIETKIGVPRSRVLIGESMGGLNVLLAGLSGRLQFSKIASLCPGLYLDSPFSSLQEMKEAVKRTGADPKVIYGAIAMAKEVAANEKEWREFSPLITVEESKARPELYLSCGLYDNYGNYEGTEAFARKALALGFKTEWHPLYGGHCAIDVSSLAEFLVR